MTVASVGCTQAPSSDESALHADANVRAYGVHSYAIDGDRASLLDQYGVQVGTLVVSAPVPERRLAVVDHLDRGTDEVEFTRPMANGTFLVKVEAVNLATAVVADAALRPLFERHEVIVQSGEPTPLSRGGVELAVETYATTTSCSAHNSSTPAGCVRPANGTVSCTNVSQYPATIPTSATARSAGIYGNDLATCLEYKASDCEMAYGGTAADWDSSSESYCALSMGEYLVWCVEGTSVGEWVASCPDLKSDGTTGNISCPGQYDAIPRRVTCQHPGSCTYSSGTAFCTSYH